MTKFVALGVATLTAGTLLASTAHAQEPTPTAGGFPTPVPTLAVIEMFIPLGSEAPDQPHISWEPVEGAVSYRLTARVQVLRVNSSNPICTPAAEPYFETFKFDDELIPHDTYRFDLPLPSGLSPEDDWFVSDIDIRLDAIDEDGNIIAQGGGFGIAETNPLFCPTPSPQVMLPETGSHSSSTGGATWPIVVGLFATAATALLGVAWRLRRASS